MKKIILISIILLIFFFVLTRQKIGTGGGITGMEFRDHQKCYGIIARSGGNFADAGYDIYCYGFIK